jgi:cytochrome P450
MAVAETIAAPIQDMSAIPGPAPLPIVGSLFNSAHYIRDVVGVMDDYFAKYGRIAGLVRGSELDPENRYNRWIIAYGTDLNRIGFNHPSVYYKGALQNVFINDGRKVGTREAPLSRWGTGLFAVNEDEHKQHRRLLMPAFHKKRIETYVDDMVHLTHDMLNSWKMGETRDVSADMMLLTMRVATKTLFGEDVGAKSQRLGDLLQQTLELVVSPKTIALPFDFRGMPYHHLLNITHEMEGYMRELIAHKQATNIDDGTVLSMLLQSRYEDSDTGLSEDEIIGHTGVIFAAGHETSSNALTWTLLLLSQFPQITRKLVAEINTVLSGRAPTLADLDKLTYLDWVIKESMRVLPTVVINERILAQDTELGGYRIKAGMHVHFSLYHLHKMAELYPEPYEFKPERWQTINPSPYEYSPFSAGHRMCIGAPFAMMEIKIVLAMLLQRYRLQAIPGTKVDRHGVITISPKDGLPLIVQPTDDQYEIGVGGLKGQVREMVNLP